jgi:hypothetical protein
MLSAGSGKLERILEVVDEPLSTKFIQSDKLNALLDLDTQSVQSRLPLQYLKTTEYPLSYDEHFSADRQ